MEQLQPISEAAFAAELAHYVAGATVMATKAGSGTGSIFTLHLRPRSGAVCYLMVWCAWKLLRAGAIICTWQDPEADLAGALAAHEGDTVASAHVASGGDVVLVLGSGAELKIFPDGDESRTCDYFLELTENPFVFSCIRGAFYREVSEPAPNRNV